MSEKLWRKAEPGARGASYEGEDVWPGDASLQQTNVQGPCDGCGMKPKGTTNKSQDVVADCYKGRPGSGGSSLGTVSHLQSNGGTSSTAVLPQSSTHFQLSKKPHSSQAACCPPEETSLEDQFSCREMDECGGLEVISGECDAEIAAVAAQNSRLGSLVSRFSLLVQDAGRLLWSSSAVLQQVREEGLQPVGARWSSHLVSLVKESKVLSVVKSSQFFSLVKGSHVFSLVNNSHIFSMVKGLPLIQRIHMEIAQHLQSEEAGRMIQCHARPNTKPSSSQNCLKAVELHDDLQLNEDDNWAANKSTTDVQLPQQQDMADGDIKQGDGMIPVRLPAQHSTEPQVTHVPADSQPLENSITIKKTDVQIFCQTLVKFPDALVNLQSLSLRDLKDSLESVISNSLCTSQKTLALYWLNAAKCSQPQPHPALLILMESGLYTLTSDSGVLVVFYHLDLLQLKEVQIGLAGQSLCLMGSAEENVLGLHTYSQKLTKELCCAILGNICPGDSRVSQHPLLYGDLTKLSLDWRAYVPDLLLDAGLRVCCQFQKTLADLVYLLHCNMDQETLNMGEVQLLLYTTVGVCISPRTRNEPLAQLLLTDTHLGLVQEDTVFHPGPCSATLKPVRTQFHDLTLHLRSDVRCVLVHDEDKSGAVRLDVILAKAGSRGHPESVTKPAIPPAHTSDSSPLTEVWKLTFSCSAEADCLINHLSNV